MADRTIQIIVDVADKTGGKLGAIRDSLLAMDKAAQRINGKIKALGLQKFAATIRLIDRVTPAGSRINAFLKGLAGKTYRIVMNLNDGVLGKIRTIESALMRLSGRAYTIGINLKDTVSGKIRGIMDGALMGAGMMGAGMLGTAGVGYTAFSALNAYKDFQYEMSKVQAVSGIKDKDDSRMIALTEQAKYMGATTEWTRSDAAKAEYYMAMAGWDSDKIVAALKPVMNLATAGGADLARTSDIVTDTMTGFGIKAGERYFDAMGRSVEGAEHYADMMAKTVTSSNTNIEQLGEALKYAAPVIGAMYANQGGQAQMNATQDALVMSGLMANAGIKGSMAGTSMRAIFSRFGSENRNAFFGLRSLGVDIFDDNGEFLPIREMAKSLQQRFKDGINIDEMTSAFEEMSGEKIHADTRRKLNSLFENVQKNGGKMTGADMTKLGSMLAGQEAMSGLLSILLGDWDELEDKIKNAHGAADEMSKTMLDNLAGSIKILQSSWDAFTQDLFEGQAGDGIRNFVDALSQIISRANKLFSDGIQLGDIGKIISDVVGRLKSKFLEFDGIGSILAGGALMAGLLKIGSTVQRTIGYFRQLKSLEFGQRLSSTSPTSAGKVSGAQSVGTMNVSAGVVNVNGRVAGGTNSGGAGAGRGRGTVTSPAILAAEKEAQAARKQAEQARLQSDKALAAAWGAPGNQRAVARAREAQTRLANAEYVATRAETRLAGLRNSEARAAEYYARREQVLARNATPPTPPAPSRFAGMKSAAAGGAIFSALFGVMDVMNQKAMGVERLADAQSKLEAARKEYQIQQSNGASQFALNEAAKAVKDAQMEVVKVERENRAAEFKAGSEATGMVIGTALGSALGSIAGPMGTMIGGVIGGMLGDYLGGIFGKEHGEEHAEREENRGKVTWDGEKWVAEEQKPAEPAISYVAPNEDYLRQASINRDRRRQADAEENERRSAQFQSGRRALADAEERASLERESSMHKVERNLEAGGTALHANTGYDFYAQQREQLAKSDTQSVGFFEQLSQSFDRLFGGENRAHAATLDEEHLAQQAAMERGEFYAPTENRGEIPAPESVTNEPAKLELPELDTENLTSQLDGISEFFSEFGTSLTENLTSAFEGASEIFSTFGESITENLTSVFDGATEIFSTFGESVSEGLAATFEGVGEIFSGLGEQIGAGMDAALSTATSSLESIQSNFTSTKDAICAAWGEVPGFFEGVFSGLGGAASAAGAAILSGLTSVCGAVIGAWEAVASTVSSIISSISAAASSVAGMIPSFGGGGAKAYAEGGFVDSPTFLVGEAGGEVVIPLSPSKRTRALELFAKTGEILGGSAVSFGGDELAQELPNNDFADNFSGSSLPNLGNNEPLNPQNSAQNSSPNQISMGGITVNFDISGAGEPQEVMDTIKENLAELADKIAAQLAKTVAAVHENQNLSV